ncbi:MULTISPECIES: transcriptional regulator [unclassified Burkholderia]|uniref:transcriptional regulator n=1 Tax=unclassified Burkholderia TaxID=2613784 RepID=UPI001E3401F8|nr:MULTISPECIES: transcriptional regulator [unclassified Burkholderia]UEP30253.1 transcriptional regulator [Burkholderia sp. B21-007]UEP44433.1 transcriptional regulator [Burkholderia sp. B21-005]
MASITCLNLSQPAAAAYTESWMNDRDVNAYAKQVKHPPVATRSATAVKPAQQAVRSPSKVPAAAHADAKPASKTHAAPAKTRKVQHAASTDPKVHAAAKPKAAAAAHTSVTIQR